MAKENILSGRTELMFFDPKKSHDDYIEFQRKVRPDEQNAIYSPLYLLRNEIYELTIRGQWFPAILLCQIAIDGIGTYFFNRKYKEFYIDYMGLKQNDYLAHRVYRNAREHNFGQLIIHLDEYWKKKIYNNFILLSNSVDKDENAEIKISFQLSESFAEVSRVVYINLLQGKQGPYYRIEYALNPKIFIEAFENGCMKLKESVKKDKKLQKVIMEDLTEDNWMRVT